MVGLIILQVILHDEEQANKHDNDKKPAPVISNYVTDFKYGEEAF